VFDKEQQRLAAGEQARGVDRVSVAVVVVVVVVVVQTLTESERELTRLQSAPHDASALCIREQ
jgi:hypothetical protein